MNLNKQNCKTQTTLHLHFIYTFQLKRSGYNTSNQNISQVIHDKRTLPGVVGLHGFLILRQLEKNVLCYFFQLQQ